MAQNLPLELMAHLARGLVDHPDRVDLVAIEEPAHMLLELRVHPDDLGKVIGRRGTSARALRTVLATAAARIRRKVVLNIVED